MDKPFEGFPVYKKALDLAKDINVLCGRVRNRDFYHLKDQIRRASSSIVLNIAEGAGKWTKKDKMNYYRIARASAFESMGALDLFKAFMLGNKEGIESLKRELVEIAGDLQALIFSIEKR